jgi:hypothetical protein
MTAFRADYEQDGSSRKPTPTPWRQKAQHHGVTVGRRPMRPITSSVIYCLRIILRKDFAAGMNFARDSLH